jgi:hypothetical protein
MENSTLRTVLQGSFLRFRSVSTKESYQINPLRTPERQKGLTLTLTKQALRAHFKTFANTVGHGDEVSEYVVSPALLSFSKEQGDPKATRCSASSRCTRR